VELKTGKMRKILIMLLVVGIVLAAIGFKLKTAEHENEVIVPGENQILIYCIVVADQPKSPGTYELRDGIPTTVGVYRFYRQQSEYVETGTFELLETIQLQEIGENIYFGKGVVDKLGEEVRDPRGWPIDNALTIGYPSIDSRWGDQNLIDGKAVVEIDQSKTEAVVLVHYWETWLRIG